MRRSYLAISVAVALVCFMADFWSKKWIMTHHVWGARYVVNRFLNIDLTANSGVAFSWFAQTGQITLFLSLTVALLVTGFILSGWVKTVSGAASKLNIKQGIASAILLGGIWGNALDRLHYGVVIDFIEIHWCNRWFFPIFNVADIWITIGWMALLWLGSGRGKSGAGGENLT